MGASKQRGRPRLEWDLETIEQLGSIQCTDYEIADILKMSHDTFQLRLKDEPEFLRVLQTARADGHSSIRRRQYELLCQDDDKRAASTMSIWLGKNYLGQADQVSVAAGLNTPITFNVIQIDNLTQLTTVSQTPSLPEAIDVESRVVSDEPAGEGDLYFG